MSLNGVRSMRTKKLHPERISVDPSPLVTRKASPEELRALKEKARRKQPQIIRSAS